MNKTILHNLIMVTFVTIFFSGHVFAQADWNTTGNSLVGGEVLGSTTNFPLNIQTNNTPRAVFTTGGFFGTGLSQGDGLRFLDPNPVGPGHLDLWVSNSQQTHIRWNGSGLIQGRASRLEICGFLNGLWFNTQTGRYIFNRDSSEVGRVGTNNLWRLGLNAGNIDPHRRLEVVDNANPQLRLSQTSNANINLGFWTDFQTNGNGNLLINPSGTRLGLNLGTTNPSHTLEVNGNARFRNFTAAASPNSLIVGVNVTGANDVELRRIAFTGNTSNVLLGNGTWGTISAGGGVGNYCAQTPSPLTGNFGIPLNNFNYYFQGQGIGVNHVGIGLNCNDPILFAKLYVRQTVANPIFNPGLSMAGQFDNTAGGTTAFGINVTTSGSANNGRAGQFSAVGTGNTNIGVYAEALNATTQNWAAVFQGDVQFNGNVIGSQFGWSDKNLKKGVTTIKNARAIIGALNPTTYFYDSLNTKGLYLPSSKQYGFIAQEVEVILPELVKDVSTAPKLDSIGNIVIASSKFKSLNYQGFISLLTQAVKEQNVELAAKDTAIAKMQGQLDQLQSALDNLTAMVSACCSAGQQMMKKEGEDGSTNNDVHTNDVTLADLDAIILNQNVPNPFSEQTEITYYLPKDVSKATFVFYNLEGKQINTLEVNQRGNGKLTVFADDLSSGVYTYSLVVDGKIAETKRMTKTK